MIQKGKIYFTEKNINKTIIQLINLLIHFKLLSSSQEM